MIRRYVLSATVLFVGLCGAIGLAAPQAGLISPSWELDIEFFDPQRITVSTATGNQTYWYVLYRVINRTGKDVRFFPSFRIVTDTLKVVDAGDAVHPGAYDAIAALHRKDFQFFAPPAKITGLLLQGAANARESAAVFQTFDPQASSFTVYMGGLAGEKVRVNNPAFDPNQEECADNPRSFLVQRTLAVMYDLPGDPNTRAVARPVRRNREWVMR
jgi:hypothetical protein